jgi:hypothetical protein
MELMSLIPQPGVDQEAPALGAFPQSSIKEIETRIDIKNTRSRSGLTTSFTKVKAKKGDSYCSFSSSTPLWDGSDLKM